MVDKTLFYLTVIAITVGVIFSYSLSAYASAYYGYSEFHFFIRQLITAVISIFLMWYISTLNPETFLKKFGFTLFFVFLFLMSIMHFLPDSVASSAGGAKRWIRLPGFSITPVEFFKIGFVYFLAWSFARKFSDDEKLDLKDEILIFLPYIIPFLIVVFLIAVVQNDLGQVVLIGVTFAFMLFLAGSSLKLFGFLLSISIVVIITAIATSHHRILRIKLWWSNIQNSILSMLPENIASSLRVENLPEPYQIFHSLNAMSNGGFFGVGIGDGIVKLGFLSEIHTDIILAGITEEIGYIGLVFVTFLIAGIIFRIFKIANRSQDKTYYLFAVGIGLLIGVSFIINAFGISGITPIKGITVPFLSYGGSSLLAISIAVGMVLSISKRAKQD